jgi:hypothetical protein
VHRAASPYLDVVGEGRPAGPRRSRAREVLDRPSIPTNRSSVHQTVDEESTGIWIHPVGSRHSIGVAVSAVTEMVLISEALAIEQLQCTDKRTAGRFDISRPY